MLIHEIIREVRDFHPDFDESVLPRKMMISAISRAERRLASRITEIREEALATEDTFSVTENDVALGVDLPRHTMVVRVTCEHAKGYRVPVSLVAWSDRDTEGLLRFPSATLMGQRLFLTDLRATGSERSGWEDIVSIDVMYVPLPGRYEKEDDRVLLPDICHDALVYMVVLWAASRTPGVMIPGILEQARMAEDQVLALVSEQDSTTPWGVRITYR
jgi:hypothetical protein